MDAWSFLRAPTDGDVRGVRRVRKAFDTPVRPFEFLLVMDFEWTADDAPSDGDVRGEVVELPAVLLDMRAHGSHGERVDAFRTYVRASTCNELHGGGKRRVFRFTHVRMARSMQVGSAEILSATHGVLPEAHSHRAVERRRSAATAVCRGAVGTLAAATRLEHP